MLKFVNYNIVFQEVPNEVSLAINISGCPHKCKGCHSPYLQKDVGEVLDEDAISNLLSKYEGSITCVCFMGGDSDTESIERLSSFIKKNTENKIKTAWYSGKSKLPDNNILNNLDFVKLGPYIEAYGGLNSSRTNQRFYKIESGKMLDKTKYFLSN